MEKVGRNDPCSCGSGKKFKKCCLISKATVSEPILLLFGAGASLGAGGMQEPPPSGAALFEKLCKSCPETWGKISANHAKRFQDTTFEEGFLELYENPDSNNVNKLLLNMGLYFSGFRIDSFNENWYYRLFDRYKSEILSGKIVLSTLNYECLIEHALIRLGLPINYYGEHGTKLLKLHGSCNFAPEGITVGPDAKLVLGLSQIHSGMKFLDPASTKEELVKGGILPAMSLYARGKKNVACEAQILFIQREFQRITGCAKAIFSIGVRPNCEDHHIWDFICKSIAEVGLIASEEHCRDWFGKYQNWQNLGEEFGSSFDNLCKRIDYRLS